MRPGPNCCRYASTCIYSIQYTIHWRHKAQGSKCARLWLRYAWQIELGDSRVGNLWALPSSHWLICPSLPARDSSFSILPRLKWAPKTSTQSVAKTQPSACFPKSISLWLRNASVIIANTGPPAFQSTIQDEIDVGLLKDDGSGAPYSFWAR